VRPVRNHLGFHSRVGADWSPRTLVYAIVEDGGACKVGKVSGKHPRERLAELQTGSSRQLFLLGYDDRLTERAPHRQLHAARLRGEWFRTEAVLPLVLQWAWLDTDLYGALRGQLCGV
jgi:hypothetical protein